MYGIIKTVLVFALLAGVSVVAGKQFLRIYAMIKSGKTPAESLTNKVGQRISSVGRMVFGHKGVMEDPWAGIMHVFFLYGFLILGIGHMELLLTGLTSFFPSALDFAPLTYGTFLPDFLKHIYHLTQDFMAGAVVIMSVIALARRFSGKVERLMPRSQDAENILWFILFLYITFFMFEGSKAALQMQQGTLSEQFHWFIPVSSPVGMALMGVDTNPLTVFHEVSYWAHLVIFLGFGVYVPFSKHMHLVFAGPNIYFSKEEAPPGLPPKIDFMDETLEKYGIDKVDEYDWKTILDTFACTECGRCNAVCPAHTTGKPLQPKKVLHDLKDNLRVHNVDDILGFRDKFGKIKADKADEHKAWEPKVPLINRDEIKQGDAAAVAPDGKYKNVDGQIHLDEIWACTTCGACIDACPVLIDSVPGSLIGLRQSQVMMEANFPEELTPAFKGMETQGNPWGIGQDKRAEWTKGEDIKKMADVEEQVEYLFWVGCAGSTDDRAKKTQKALVKILKASNVDFAILGCEEKCVGDPARRMGNEYVFDALAQENAATLEGYKTKFQKIFTSCPHCFNSLKNEYPAYGVKQEILHHTQLIAELMKDKRIPLDDKKVIEEQITFHDPCYMSRYNDEVDAPRAVLDGLPGVETVEMPRAKKKSFCCGAGGGRMFMEEHIGERVNVVRTEEALVTLGTKKSKAQSIAVACPFCMTMVTDGTKAKDAEENVAVKDLAELVAERLQA